MSGAWICEEALIMCLACDCWVQNQSISGLPELLTRSVMLRGPRSGLGLILLFVLHMSDT